MYVGKIDIWKNQTEYLKAPDSPLKNSFESSKECIGGLLDPKG